jgi:tetratricopeptide (TPR) repeat protein
MQGKLDEASLELGRALELEPESVWGLRQQGWVLAGLGRDREAEAHFRNAVDLEPDDLWTRLELVEFLGYRERVDDARQILEQALDHASDDEAAAMVGLYLRMFGFPEEGRQVLQQAIEENGEDVAARIHLARIYREGGEPELAREVLAPAERQLTAELTREGFEPSSTRQLAYVQALTGRADDCRETLDRIVTTVAELLAEDLYDLGCVAALNGDVERSLELLGQAIEAGFRDFDWARHDPDLTSLAGDPRLEKLLTPR